MHPKPASFLCGFVGGGGFVECPQTMSAFLVFKPNPVLPFLVFFGRRLKKNKEILAGEKTRNSQKTRKGRTEKVTLVNHRSRSQRSLAISHRNRSQTLRSQEILQKELFLGVRLSFDCGRRFRAFRSLSDRPKRFHSGIGNCWHSWLCQSVLNQLRSSKDTRSCDQSFCNDDRDRNFDCGGPVH